MMFGHVSAILEFRVGRRVVDGTLVDATTAGILFDTHVLQLGGFSNRFRVSCPGGVLAC